MNAPARVDHLVVVADSLEQGTAWCEATLGDGPDVLRDLLVQRSETAASSIGFDRGVSLPTDPIAPARTTSSI